MLPIEIIYYKTNAYQFKTNVWDHDKSFLPEHIVDYFIFCY